MKFIKNRSSVVLKINSFLFLTLEFNFIENEDLWTVWSNPRRVPEPSSGILFISTLLVIYFFRRNKYRQQ